MLCILDKLYQYVPKRSFSESVVVGETEYSVSVDATHTILLGGDQMTAARCRGCKTIRSNSDSDSMKLNGFHPVSEDWHAKVVLLEVIWSRLYDTTSSTDQGTLQHLRNLINRRNVVSVAKKDVNANEDFFLLVVQSHVVCAAMKLFDIETVDSIPDYAESEWNLGTKEERQSKLLSLAYSIVESFVDLSFFVTQSETPQSVNEPDTDHALEYAKEVISLGLLYMEFQDSVREGDGERVLNCWRYLMLLFKATGHRNYALEAFYTLAHQKWILPKRQAMQLTYSRFINVHGRPGCNVPCDLHMEHLNRLVKSCVSHLSNKTEASIERIGKSLSPVYETVSAFDEDNGLAKASGKHSAPSRPDDKKQIIKLLIQNDALTFVPGRKHNSFKKFLCNVMKRMDEDKTIKWMEGHYKNILTELILQNRC